MEGRSPADIVMGIAKANEVKMRAPAGYVVGGPFPTIGEGSPTALIPRFALPAPVFGEAKSITPERVPQRHEVKSIERIGAGGMGEIFRVFLKNGKRAVLKINNTKEVRSRGYPATEIYLACSYRHRNFMKGIGVRVADRYGGEFIGRGLAILLASYDSDLHNYVHNPNTRIEAAANIIKIFADIINGYRALRALGFVHLDIKPANMLVRYHPFRVVLSDFGTCLPIPRSTDTRVGLGVGTLPFMPPEAKTPRGDDMNMFIAYGEPFDMYSLGVVFGVVINAYTTAIPAASQDRTLIQLVGETITKLATPATRWSFQELIDSNFYTYLLARKPNRRYVNPRMVVHPTFNSADEIKFAEAAYNGLYVELSKVKARILRADPSDPFRELTRRISVGCIGYAENLIWSIAKYKDKLGILPGDLIVKVILWMAITMFHGYIPREDLFEMDAKRGIQAQEAILEITAPRMTLNTLIDIAPTSQELPKALTFRSTTATDMTNLFHYDTLIKFPLSYDSHDVPLASLEFKT